MNASNDPVLDRIENAERMLRQARTEHGRGNAEDVGEFLAAARRNIDRAAEALKKTATIAELPRSKEAAHAR
jgi:hypothetical protein